MRKARTGRLTDHSRRPASSHTVNLGTHAASQIWLGAVGGFANINKLVGSASAADTLTGSNANTDWVISAANGGKAGSVGFSGFENLVGGSGVDSFRFLAGGSLTGTLDGGLAPAHDGNWLDYSGLTAPVTVNLHSGAATDVAGGAAAKVANIQNVHGGNGGNTLTGNSLGNILIGGTGNDVLIGGSSPRLARIPGQVG
jgi:Ca2+-binding RTX toxin-like protein